MARVCGNGNVVEAGLGHTSCSAIQNFIVDERGWVIDEAKEGPCLAILKRGRCPIGLRVEPGKICEIGEHVGISGEEGSVSFDTCAARATYLNSGGRPNTVAAVNPESCLGVRRIGICPRGLGPNQG